MTDIDLPVSIAADAGQTLIARGEKVSVAESSTGGLIAATLLAVPGASGFFEGGSVVYTLASRRAYLDLAGDRVRELKPLSEPMVAVFAEAAAAKLEAAWGIAELGAAGPTGSRYGHDAGTSVIGVWGPVSMQTTVVTGSDDRLGNMAAFTAAAIELFAAAVTAAAES